VSTPFVELTKKRNTLVEIKCRGVFVQDLQGFIGLCAEKKGGEKREKHQTKGKPKNISRQKAGRPRVVGNIWGVKPKRRKKQQRNKNQGRRGAKPSPNMWVCGDWATPVN